MPRCLHTAAVVLFPLLTVGPARASWIAHYFQAYDLCGPRFPGLNALLTRDGPGALLGRPAEAWTHDDLASLPRLFTECRRIAAARGAQIDLSGVLPDLERIVTRAWTERDQRLAEAEATARRKEEASRQAAAKVQAELARAEAAQHAAERARTTAHEQAQREIARDNALAAEAEAARDIALARRSAAEARSTAAQAQAEADAARRLVEADEAPAGPGDLTQGRSPSAAGAQALPGGPPQVLSQGQPSTAAPTHIRIGQRAKVVIGFLGCRSTEDYQELKRLTVGAADALAAARYADAHDCRRIAQGTVGTVEDVAVLSDASCLREAGEPQCAWLPASFLVRAE